MPTTITLKNIPDDIYERLKQIANLNHRSLNSEVIACLERTLLPTRISSDERLARARQLRDSLKYKFDAEEIDKAIEEGRP